MDDKEYIISLKKSLRKASDTIKILNTELEYCRNSYKNVNEEPEIAIIGMACRFPGNSNDLDSFWDFLEKGICSARKIPQDRWDINHYYDKNPVSSGKVYTKFGSFLDTDISEFDADFFEISSQEAKSMDPQQRLLLEVSWEAFENSGININKLKESRIGIYLGICSNEYGKAHLMSGNKDKIDQYSLTGSIYSTSCGRLSYFYDFFGPSLTLDTACSSSLVALNLAVQSLKKRESNLALAGGVNLLLIPESYIALSKLQALSPDGKCKAFDATADGYGRGEGCGLIVLKRMDEAIRDRDNILAIIKGVGVGHDGKSNGLISPNKIAQEQLILETLKDANLTSDDIDYLECHGTGTHLGDHNEIDALANIFRDRKLLIGTLKTNIGHLESAAGIAGLIKLVLALQKKIIPPTVKFTKPNQDIPWDNIPIEVVYEKKEWIGKDKPRIGSISSFGISGTLSHLILQESPEIKKEMDNINRNIHILSFSAKTKTAILQLIKKYQKYMINSNERIEDITYTSNISRTYFNYRASLIGNSKKDFARQLKKNTIEIIGSENKVKHNKIVFLFAGEDLQYVNTAKELFLTSPFFKKNIEICDQLFGQYIDYSIVDLLYSDKKKSTENNIKISTPSVVFSIELSLLKLWQSWGIQPSLLLGYGIGQYIAAYAAGVFSLEDAVKMTAGYENLINSLPKKGKLAVLFSSEEKVKSLLVDDAKIYAVNANNNVTISGDEGSITKLLKKAEKLGIDGQILKSENIYPTINMNKKFESFKKTASEITCYHPAIPIISVLNGEKTKNEIFNPDYWIKCLNSPIRFFDAIKTIEKLGYQIFLEISGASLLSTYINNISFQHDIFVYHSLDLKNSNWFQMLTTLSELYKKGIDVDWEEFDKPYKRNKVLLPNYPFQKKKYWIELNKEEITTRKESNEQSEEKHPLTGEKLDFPSSEIRFDNVIDLKNLSFIKGHSFQRQVIMPFTAYIEIGHYIGQNIYNKNFMIKNLSVLEPMFLEENNPIHVQYVIKKENRNYYDVKVFGKYKRGNTQRSWNLYAGFEIWQKGQEDSKKENNILIDEITDKDKKTNNRDNFYKKTVIKGWRFDKAFKRIDKIWWNEDEFLIRINDLSLKEKHGFNLHPGLLDAGLQLVGASISEDNKDFQEIDVPVNAGKVSFFSNQYTTLWAYLKKDNSMQNNLLFTNEKGKILCKIEDVRFAKTKRENLIKKLNIKDFLYKHIWINQPLLIPNKKSENKKKWLIFALKINTNIIINKLRSNGNQCILVYVGKKYEKKDENCYLINPSIKEDYERLFNNLNSDVKNEIDGIIYFWNQHIPPLDANDYNNDSSDWFTFSCISILYILKSLFKQKYNKYPRLWLITKGVFNIKSNQTLPEVFQSPIWGLGSTVTIEYPELKCIRIDFDPRIENINHNSDLFINELLYNKSENQIAYRGKERYILRLNSIELNDNKSVVKISNSETYLITGGFGSLGIIFCEWLVAQGAKNIVLIGRGNKSSNYVNSKISKMINKGINIISYQVDVSDFKKMENVISEIKLKLPSLKGIIHAAGVLDDNILIKMNQESFQRVFLPKITGTWNLHKLTIDCELNFFICFSSIASTLGSIGQGNYSAANAFLDVFSHYRNYQNLKCMTINWGPWDEIGMFNSEIKSKFIVAELIEPIRENVGIEIFNYLINSGEKQVSIIKFNKSKLGELFKKIDIPLLNDIAKTIHEDSIEIEQNNIIYKLLNSVEEDDYFKKISDFLIKIISPNLAIDNEKIDINENLLSLGFDSLGAIGLQNKLKDDFDYELSLFQIMNDNLSIYSITNMIIDEIKKRKINISSNNNSQYIERQVYNKVNEIDDLSENEINNLSDVELDKYLNNFINKD